MLNKQHESSEKEEEKVIEGRVVLMKKYLLDFNDFDASILDQVDEFLGNKISFQLVSALNPDPDNEGKGKLGKPSYLENWMEKSSGMTPGDLAFDVKFHWDDDIGLPGAMIVKNKHRTQFYLKTITLENVPEHGTIHFVCNSWVYPTDRYKMDRVFFTNKTYLPKQTPEVLRKYREEELVTLRGSGEGKLEEWDRVYDYALYNDLSDPDKGQKFVRPILGGSPELPYPRRQRTGRPPTITDPNTESKLPLALVLEVYVPRDERFRQLKMSDFLGHSIKSLSQDLVAGVQYLLENTPNEFDSFEDQLRIYEGGIKLPDWFQMMWENIPFQLLKAALQPDDGALLRFPMPQIIKEDKSAWRSDEEFARETIAGANPLVIRRLEEFPPKSKLDPKTYGNQDSTITNQHIEQNLDGLTVDEAIKNNRLFILDHHDTLMPLLRKINSTPSKVYASRTILFLKDDGTLKPLAIELSLPHEDGDEFGATSKVYTPAQDGVQGSIWQLAKAYVSTNDQGHHQIFSHWTLSHVVMEPFVIVTNRQLSVVHPIYKLLHPHLRDTLYINAIARQILLNAGGLIEHTVFPRKYGLEWSSSMYKDWVFTEQAVPVDLVKRGMAMKDPESPHGCKLFIEDYPYAVDALEVWSAIETWVNDYCSFYYESDDSVVEDTELQSWWREVREEAHGDKRDAEWWPKMKTLNDLTQTCTTIIWIARPYMRQSTLGSTLHGGYHPNRPTITRRFMPEPGTPEYHELETNPDRVFMRTISNQLQTLLGISLIELLSRHSSEEVYLGQRDSPEWTLDVAPLQAFERFGKTLKEIEEKITERNTNGKWRNRVGPVNMPYTLLYPSSEMGLTGRGIPNSTSI